MAKDYYGILAVSRNATQEQIRDRFRELTRKRHPDRFQGREREKAELEFQDITEAFNVLSNPVRRRQHDLELTRPDTSSGNQDAQRLCRFHMEAGVTYYRDRNFGQAAESFDRATRADPKNAQAWHHLAQAVYQQKRQLSVALSAIAKAVELTPMNVAFLKLAGKIHAEAGLVDKAEQYYNEALTWGGEDDAVRAALEELRGSSKKSGWTGLFGKGT